MSRFFICIAMTLCLLQVSAVEAKDTQKARVAATADSAVNFITPKVCGIKVNVVVVDMRSNRVRVRPVTARDVPGAAPRLARTFASFVRRLNPIAAINGTFFDPKTFETLGHLVEDGRLVHKGYVGNALAVDFEGRPHFLKVTRKSARKVNWKPYAFAICGGPTLVYRGKIALNPRAEGFRDPRVFGPARRSAIGVTAKGKLLLVTVHCQVSLKKLAAVMQSLGSDVALNLDGGSSSGLFYKGSWITRPRRSLTNVLAVEVVPISKNSDRPTPEGYTVALPVAPILNDTALEPATPVVPITPDSQTVAPDQP